MGKGIVSIDVNLAKKRTITRQTLKRGDSFSFPDGHDMHPCIVLQDMKILDLFDQVIRDEDEIDFDDVQDVNVTLNVLVT